VKEKQLIENLSVLSHQSKIKKIIVPASGPWKESATGDQKVSGRHVSLSSILQKRKGGN
jgi:hypothetical protein